MALTTADIAWSPATVLLIVLTVVSGTAIFSALFTAAGGLQFFLVDGAEFTNAFTYGGPYAAQQSQQVFPDPLRIFWTFVIPTAFVAYLPAVAILDLPGDHLAPTWLAWCTPLAALLAWTIAGLLLEARDPSLPRSRRMSIIEIETATSCATSRGPAPSTT